MGQDFSDDFRLRETAEREEFEQEFYTSTHPTAYARKRRLQEKDDGTVCWTKIKVTIGQKSTSSANDPKPRLPASAFRRVDWRVRSEWIRRRKRALGNG